MTTSRTRYLIETFIEDRLDDLPRVTPGDRLLRKQATSELAIGRAQADHLDKNPRLIVVGSLPMPWLLAAANWRHHKDFRPEWEL